MFKGAHSKRRGLSKETKTNKAKSGFNKKKNPKSFVFHPTRTFNKSLQKIEKQERRKNVPRGTKINNVLKTVEIGYNDKTSKKLAFEDKRENSKQ